MAFGKAPVNLTGAEKQDEPEAEEKKKVSEESEDANEDEDDDEDLASSNSKTFNTITEMPFEEDQCTTFNRGNQSK